MRLGVVAALRTEIKPTLVTLDRWLTLLDGVPAIACPPFKPFAFTVSGVGAARAEAAARALPADLDGLLSVGFCGALTDDLAPGDLLLGGTTDHEASPDLLDLARKCGPHRAASVTRVDHVIVDSREKEEIAKRSGAAAVDMESGAVAEVALERGLKFLCVKVVLDTPSKPLACSYSSGGRVALQILRRPWIIPRMWDDGRRAREGAERLRDFFVAFRKELNPSEA